MNPSNKAQAHYQQNLVKLGPFMPICHQYKGILPKWAFHAHFRPTIKVDIDKGSPVSAFGPLKWTCELLVGSDIYFSLLREILHTSVSTTLLVIETQAKNPRIRYSPRNTCEGEIRVEVILFPYPHSVFVICK